MRPPSFFISQLSIIYLALATVSKVLVFVPCREVQGQVYCTYHHLFTIVFCNHLPYFGSTSPCGTAYPVYHLSFINMTSCRYFDDSNTYFIHLLLCIYIIMVSNCFVLQ